MDAKFIFVLFALFLNVHCYGDYDYSNVELPSCASGSATLYHANVKGQIGVDYYVNGKHQEDKNTSIAINSTRIQALAYDYQHKEVLFVDSEKPDSIFGVSSAVDVHLVLQEAGTHFDYIVVDPATNNLYFADNLKGIGVCVGHVTNTSCTLLIGRANSEAAISYKDLILLSQHGTMFWIQMEKGKSSEVNMASMSGYHVRKLKQLNFTQSLVFDTENNKLITTSSDGKLTDFNIKDHSIEKHDYYGAKQIFYLNCYAHSLEIQTQPSKEICEQYGGKCYESKPKNKLVLQHLLKADAFGSRLNYSDAVATVVLDNDQTPKSNPCGGMKCDGICVMAEAFPEPIPECITTTHESLKQVFLETPAHSSSLNGFLLAMTILLSLTLISVMALVISPKLRLGLRDRISRVFGKNPPASFSNQTSRSSTVSVATNEI